MRLIDADKLREKATNAKKYDPEMMVVGLGYVFSAPTIEPVKHEPCDFCKRYNFSNARAEVNKYGAYISLAGGNTQFPRHEQFNFCPVCGRKL